MLGDGCYPEGDNWALGGNGTVGTVPACIAEQYISMKCEEASGVLHDESPENFKAYRKCLLGEPSSYRSEVLSCVLCKANHQHMTSQQYDWWRVRWERALDAYPKQLNPRQLIWVFFLDRNNLATIPPYPRGWKAQPKSHRLRTSTSMNPEGYPKQQMGAWEPSSVGRGPIIERRQTRTQQQHEAEEVQTLTVVFRTINGKTISADVKQD